MYQSHFHLGTPYICDILYEFYNLQQFTYIVT